MNNYSRKFDVALQEKLKEFFVKKGADISTQQYAFWRAKTSGYSAAFYNSGKFLIQGAQIDDIAAEVERFLGADKPFDASTYSTSSDISVQDLVSVPVKRIGVDESGKGDFFGPLVVAGVMVDEKNTQILLDANVRDCKMVDDKQINKLAALIKNNCVFSVVTINPVRYNELYRKFGNLNLLLAWGHARAIENILEKEDCSYAISDKFGDEKLIKNALMTKGQNIQLEQKCKAESDIAVAAASIVARAQFLKVMSELSDRYNIELPKGASNRVVDAARQFSSVYSKNELSSVAKIHFKTFEQI